jgi:hypothetical protein
VVLPKNRPTVVASGRTARSHSTDLPYRIWIRRLDWLEFPDKTGTCCDILPTGVSLQSTLEKCAIRRYLQVRAG